MTWLFFLARYPMIARSPRSFPLRSMRRNSPRSVLRSRWPRGVGGGRVVVEQRIGMMQPPKRTVCNHRVSLHEADLVQRISCFYFDGERPGYDFQVERAMVPGPDFIESGVQIGDHAGEHVQPSGRALGIRSGADRIGECKRFRATEPDRHGPFREWPPRSDPSRTSRGRTDKNPGHSSRLVIAMSSGRKLLMSR